MKLILALLVSTIAFAEISFKDKEAFYKAQAVHLRAAVDYQSARLAIVDATEKFNKASAEVNTLTDKFKAQCTKEDKVFNIEDLSCVAKPKEEKPVDPKK